jgi:uncharacterized protein (TIGR03083 family)
VGVNADPRTLLGAYALDALDAEEAAAVEALIADDAGADRELHRLRGAAAWIGATEALAPPRDLRSQLLDRAVPVAEDLRVYRMAVARHAALLDTLTDDDLDAPTTNGLSVGELVVHLASMESAVAETVGFEQALTDERDVAMRTRHYLEAFGADPLGAGRAEWRTAAAALDDWAAAGGTDGGVPWAGITVGRRTLLTTRAFELWTHDDDIRDALGRDPSTPAPAELGVMADVAVQILPFCLTVSGSTAAASARIVLTGDGGGDWTVSLDGDDHGRPAVTITMDVVDYCRVVAERLDPTDAAVSVTGDATLGRTVLACASALATL